MRFNLRQWRYLKLERNFLKSPVLKNEHRIVEAGSVDSAIHTDFVSNVGAFVGTSDEVKRAAHKFFEQAFSPDFTLDEAGAMLAWLTPHLHGWSDSALPP